MVRRETSSASNEGDSDSHQESSQVPTNGTNGTNGVKAKAEKVKMEKVKKEKQRESRRAPVEDDDEGQEEEDQEDQEEDEDEGLNGERDVEGDAEGEDEDEEEDEGGSSQGRKRARVDEDGEARHVKPERGGKTRVKTLPRGEDGFVPGSIVRIQLRNFVTYDWVEFRPGPYLNMILGPNGTGKSSIACAICLGLNWPPSILGRASELNSFVKLGATDGHIEIELRGPPGRPNLVIRRNINSGTKGSNFTLNGKSATGADIKNKVAALNVQVGNLCSFLPQDKVSEFAQMSSQQLLKETQRAAGDENLSSWHQTLIDSGKDLKSIQDLIEGERNQLKQMQERNEGLEREVERFHQRRIIEQRIEDLEILILINVYEEIREVYLTHKTRQRALHDIVKQLKDKNEPAHALLNTYAQKHTELNKLRDSAKKKCTATFARMKAKWADNDRLEKEADDLNDDLEKQKETEKRRLAKIKQFEKDIAKWQEELDNPPETEDETAIQQEAKKANEGRADFHARQATLQARQRENADATGRQNAILTGCYKDLKALDDAGARKLEDLRRWDPATYDAVVWLRNNQNEFQKEILEPPCLCLNITDKRFTSPVEACFNSNQLRMLVAQTQEDYDKLNHILNDSGKVLKQGARVNTWFRRDGPIPGPPITREEMSDLGFQGYAMDYVDYPEGMTWFLKRELNLHRTAIGLDGSRVPVQRAMEAVSRLGPNGEGGSASFIAGYTLNMVSRSRYGQKKAQNMTREFRAARNLVQTPIDPSAKKRIDDKIKEAKVALSAIEAEAGELTEEDAEIRQHEREYTTRMSALKKRSEEVRKIKTHLSALGNKIKTQQKSLETLKKEPSMETRTERLRGDILKVSQRRLKVAKSYTELMRSLIRDQAEATRVVLEWAQVGANKAALDSLCKAEDEEYQKALLEFNEAHDAYTAAKAESKTAVDISKAALDSATDEVRERIKAKKDAGTHRERNAEQLRGDLETEQHNLELNRGANAGVVQQYESRKREIEKLIAVIEGREKNADKVERAIKNARDNWEPALEKLVASIGKKFSGAFDRIGCAGEIRISRHEDFDKWAIDILVKFRDNERLQLLTAQRQSGGERSLTTILYLMSLTEEARSPFSLVDEINQGMDMRAERAVHNSLVETTCKPDSAQYFLITPKLLPDLHYDERMKVLCVNNGEWLPEENDIGNMMSMIENFVQRRNRSANAV